MKATPLFLGACAFASIAGAVGGATTNTDPIQRGGIGSEMLPERSFAFDPADDGMPDEAPPDQYAMITPQGRVEIAELSTRGLYSQQRFGWREASYEPPSLPEFEKAPAPWDESPAVEDHAEPFEPTQQVLDVPAAGAVTANESGPRIIDVGAALAAGQ